MANRKLTPRQFQKNQQEAQRRWRQEHAKSINVQFNTDTDADILSKLASVPNKTDYLRQLIRKDLEDNN